MKFKLKKFNAIEGNEAVWFRADTIGNLHSLPNTQFGQMFELILVSSQQKTFSIVDIEAAKKELPGFSKRLDMRAIRALVKKGYLEAIDG